MEVFPRRNLPGSAEQWGRIVEGRIEGVETVLESLGQSVTSQNRTTAASLQLLGSQVDDLATVANDLALTQNSLSQTQSDLADTIQDVADLQAAMPTPAVFNNTGTGFSISTSYTNKATLTVPGVAGKTSTLLITGEGGFEQTDAIGAGVTYMRLQVGGVAQAETFMTFGGYGLSTGGGNRFVGTTTYAVTRGVGQSTVINLQARSTNASMTPARAGNYASIFVIVVYSG